MQSPPLHVIRKSSFTATPWKNGGGITHEAIRVPATGDPFRWRVSVAHIDVSGPFSDFAAYHRKMVLLRGAGIELSFGDGARKTLRQVGDLVEFDGAVAAHCELLSGPCVDLNLMILKSAAAAVRVERFVESFAVTVPPNATMLIFPIDRGVTLAIDDADGDGREAALEPWDLAVLSHGAGHVRRLEFSGPARPDAAGGCATAVFVATLDPAG